MRPADIGASGFLARGLTSQEGNLNHVCIILKSNFIRVVFGLAWFLNETVNKERGQLFQPHSCWDNHLLYRSVKSALDNI